MSQALVDFPGQTRRVISFKRLALTDYTVDIPRLAKKAVLKKALEEAGAWRGRSLLKMCAVESVCCAWADACCLAALEDAGACSCCLAAAFAGCRVRLS